MARGWMTPFGMPNARSHMFCARSIPPSFHHHHSAQFATKVRSRVIFVLFKHFLWSGRPRSVWQPITIQSSFKNKRSPTVHHRSNRRVFRRNRFDGFRFERNLFVVLKTPAAATAAFNPKYVTTWEISLRADH